MIDALRTRIAELGAKALLVTQPANVRYLSGFTSPEDARVLILEETALLLTDGRYIAQAKEQSRLEVDIFLGPKIERVADLAKGHQLAVEADHLTLEHFQDLSKHLGQTPIATKGLVAELRLTKSEKELKAIRKAAQITDKAFSHILGFIKEGVSEIEVALELERFMRGNGAEDKAFAITVASGYRSSMPHGTASEKIIAQGELITLDFGAKVAGYHSDMTRTLALGAVPTRQRAIYEAVLKSQTLALEALGPHKDGKALDAVAREYLKGQKLDQYFSHSLGHGVGLEIHENPRLSFLMSHILKPNMVVTVEPGVYIPGEAGVRIEDLCLITESGYECLSQSAKDFIQL